MQTVAEGGLLALLTQPSQVAEQALESKRQCVISFASHSYAGNQAAWLRMA